MIDIRSATIIFLSATVTIMAWKMYLDMPNRHKEGGWCIEDAMLEMRDVNNHKVCVVGYRDYESSGIGPGSFFNRPWQPPWEKSK